MQHLHEVWGKLQPGSRKKANVQEFNKAKDAREEVQLVNEVSAVVAKKTEAPSPAGSPRFTPTAAADKAGAPSSAGSSGAMPTATGEKARAQPSAGNPGYTADEIRLVEIFIPVPENWLHRQSLVYVMFGKMSKATDVDLDLAASDGLANRKRKIDSELDSDSATDGESLMRSSADLLSKRAVKRLAIPNASNSRAEHKTIKMEQARNVHAHGFRDKVLNEFQNLATEKDQPKLVSCVETFTASMLKGARIKDREHQITCLK